MAMCHSLSRLKSSRKGYEKSYSIMVRTLNSDWIKDETVWTTRGILFLWFIFFHHKVFIMGRNLCHICYSLSLTKSWRWEGKIYTMLNSPVDASCLEPPNSTRKCLNCLPNPPICDNPSFTVCIKYLWIIICIQTLVKSPLGGGCGWRVQLSSI
jgi:hypothetical protein